MLIKILRKFWDWYDRHYALNVGIAAFLFTLQLAHLYWLFCHVIMVKLTGQSLFNLNGFWENLIILVDYTEIPAIIVTSLVYVDGLRKKFTWTSLLMLLFINTQWIHLLWITDEFVVESFLKNSVNLILPAWLAWVAIMIDYLELPVIYDTIKKFTQALLNKNFRAAAEILKEK